MASNRAVITVTDRNGRVVHSVELKVPQAGTQDAIKQALVERAQLYRKLFLAYDTADHYFFTNWLSQRTPKEAVE